MTPVFSESEMIRRKSSCDMYHLTAFFMLSIGVVFLVQIFQLPQAWKVFLMFGAIPIAIFVFCYIHYRKHLEVTRMKKTPIFIILTAILILLQAYLSLSPVICIGWTVRRSYTCCLNPPLILIPSISPWKKIRNMKSLVNFFLPVLKWKSYLL